MASALPTEGQQRSDDSAPLRAGAFPLPLPAGQEKVLPSTVYLPQRTGAPPSVLSSSRVRSLLAQDLYLCLKEKSVLAVWR